LPSEQDRPDIARKRWRFEAVVMKVDARRFYFIDETWAKTNMAPLRGWCQKGCRLNAKVPYGHWKTMTFIAALHHDGIAAPCVFDGPINRESFRAWVKQFLIPLLKPGDIVVLDNLAAHKCPEVRRAIRAVGAKIFFLPAYSPDFNPIEQFFAKLKHLLRKAAERTVEATWGKIGSLLKEFSAQECANYIRNAGYLSI
jgi:transposase